MIHDPNLRARYLEISPESGHEVLRISIGVETTPTQDLLTSQDGNVLGPRTMQLIIIGAIRPTMFCTCGAYSFLSGTEQRLNDLHTSLLATSLEQLNWQPRKEFTSLISWERVCVCVCVCVSDTSPHQLFVSGFRRWGGAVPDTEQLVDVHSPSLGLLRQSMRSVPTRKHEHKLWGDKPLLHCSLGPPPILNVPGQSRVRFLS